MSRVKVGKYFFKQGGGINTVLPIIAPADNKQGVILRTITLGSGGGSTISQTVLYANAVAPVAPGDPNCRSIAVFNASGNTFVSTIVPYEIEVPAGLGVWLGCGGNCQAQITYDFIDV
jgi:hypothetical protein